MTDRIPLDHLTSDQLDALYERLAAEEADNEKLRHWLLRCSHREPRERAEAAIARVRKAIDSVKAAGAGHTPTTPYNKGVAAGVDWVTGRVLGAIDARLVNEPTPAPATTATEPCSGFPDGCPNLVVVAALSPYHGGGIRCGCGDQPKEQ